MTKEMITSEWFGTLVYVIGWIGPIYFVYLIMRWREMIKEIKNQKAKIAELESRAKLCNKGTI
jgi:hypothetical protein